MTQLLVTSLYEDDGRGTLRLIEQIDMQKEPWFWSPVVEISCKQKKYPEVYPPWGGQHLRFPVQPKGPPGRWVDVVDQTEDGKTILVGRIPVWDEFWSGSPPTSLRSEIQHAEVDAFLGSMMQGTASSTKAFFEEEQTQRQSLLPPKTMFGYNFPVGPVASGPRGQDPRGPLDPRRPDTGPDIRPGDSSNCWERICCIGLDVEKREVTAIVDVTQTAGYGGPPCSSRSYISVGFWLVEPSWAEIGTQTWESDPVGNVNDFVGDKGECSRKVRFLGSSRFKISDIPRQIRSVDCKDKRWIYDTRSLAFASSLALRPEDLDYIRNCSQRPRLPVLHCVVAFNQEVTNRNFLGHEVRFGDYAQRVVQYPISVPCRPLIPGIETITINDALTKAKPVHVANLPNGDILFFSGSIYGKENTDGQYDTRHSVAIIRPSTNEIIPVEDPPFDIFCAGHSTLGNGNVVIMGGTKRREEEHRGVHHWPGLRDVTIFDWRTSTFKKLNYEMREGRWYPSSVVLGNGEVFICDGHPTLASTTHTNFDLEILSSDGERIVKAIENGNVSMGSADFTNYIDKDENQKDKEYTVREQFQGLYPRMMLLPNGEVFSATSLRSLPVVPQGGKVREEDRINKKIVERDKDGKNHVWILGRIFRDNSHVFNPQQPWVNRQVFEAPQGEPDSHGPIWGFADPAVLLPLDVNSSSDTVRSQPRVMTFLNGRDCTIEPLAVNPQWIHAKRKRDKSLDYLGRMRDDRYRVNGNLVLLPDGSVMAVGGLDAYHKSPTIAYIEEKRVEEVEYFVPGAEPSQDYWRTDKRSRIAVPRQYHSTAILLLDGRVMVGGGDLSAEYARNMAKGGSVREIEIITPDYYENGPRPEFVIEHDSLTYGDVVSISLISGTTVNELSTLAILIRCASFTHAFGYDQRAVRLYPYGSMTSSRYSIRVPRNSNILPPGYYMCFVVSNKGVPSCGQMIKIG